MLVVRVLKIEIFNFIIIEVSNRSIHFTWHLLASTLDSQLLQHGIVGILATDLRPNSYYRSVPPKTPKRAQV